jgi:hypothetical protein
MAASRATPHPLMPPPMIRRSKSSPEAPVIVPKYKEFDRKIRISAVSLPRHYSAHRMSSAPIQGGRMQNYRVVAVGDPIASAVRRTMKSPGYGHAAHAEVATGYGPCRQCLRTFAVGEERRILFTHDPFHGKESLPLPGPVFIHEGECVRYPEDAGFPSDILTHSLTLNAYGAGRRLLAQRYVTDGIVEPELQQLLQNRDVAYIHVRDTKAGCYDFSIERISEETNLKEAGAANGGGSHE